MSKELSVIALGVWIIVIPYLGVPGSWRTTFLVLTGLGIAALGFFLRGEAIRRGTVHTKHNSFIESAPHGVDSRDEEKQGINSLN